MKNLNNMSYRKNMSFACSSNSIILLKNDKNMIYKFVDCDGIRILIEIFAIKGINIVTRSSAVFGSNKTVQMLFKSYDNIIHLINKSIHPSNLNLFSCKILNLKELSE